MTVAADPRLSPQLDGANRLLPMAYAVIEEVAHKLAAAPRPYRGPVDLWLALPESRPGFPEHELQTTAKQLTTSLAATGTSLRADLVGRGHAGVAQVIERAAQEAAVGREVLTVVVGIDSYIHPETLTWLEHERLFGPDARNGFHPGEAAGCLVLASPRLRHVLGLPCLATIAGVATAREQRLPGSETGSFGEGMTQALRGAVAGLQFPDQAVDTIYCDINGERYRSEEWAFVNLREPTAIRAPGYDAPADCWGDVGAASGALFGVLAVRAWARGYAAGPHALALTGSSNGLRGAILFEQPSRQGPNA
ncbi:hypothetical protein [Enhygromyxa salina]|nr:hypothetical protein [Enhygromyxa salina]